MELNLANNSELPKIQDDLKEKIEESKKQIAQDQAAPLKKRGRPRKSGETVATPQQASAPLASLPTAPPPDVAAFLETPLIAISKIPASRHGIPELELSPDEARACAASLQAVLNAFLPNVNAMSPKTAAIIGVFTTFGAIGYTKYAIYIEKRPEPVPPSPDEVQNKINSEIQKDRVRAENLFNNKRNV